MTPIPDQVDGDWDHEKAMIIRGRIDPGLDRGHGLDMKQQAKRDQANREADARVANAVQSAV